MEFSISKITQTRELLNHILEMPELPAVVQRLDVHILTKLIRHVGLEDSAEIVSFATVEQLKGVLDEDLWHSETPGLHETFDGRRFGLWLEIMMESGSTFAARKMMELDQDLVALGLCKLVLVLDPADPTLRFERDPYTGDRIMERFLDGSLSQEFGRYLVAAKDESSWDSVCALMAALNELDYEALIRLLNRCCWVSGEEIEDKGGLEHVFTSGEMLEEDVSAERNERREGKGFVTPTSAAVFLSQARSAPLAEAIASETMDPVTRAHLRAVEAENEAAAKSRTSANTRDIGSSGSIQPNVGPLIQILRDGEVLPSSHERLLGYDGKGPRDHLLPFESAMGLINQTDPDLFSQRLRELSYLSNTLISGCGFKGHAFQPKEAAEAAFSVCNLGGEYLLKSETGGAKGRSADPSTALLKAHHLDKLFRIGWKILFDDVVLSTANAVLAFIHQQKDEIRDPEQILQMARMASLLRSSISSGRPWDFHDQMDELLHFLDGGAVEALAALLQPYPTLTEVIRKKSGHRLFPFVWSQRHIAAIHRFLEDTL